MPPPFSPLLWWRLQHMAAFGRPPSIEREIMMRFDRCCHW